MKISNALIHAGFLIWAISNTQAGTIIVKGSDTMLTLAEKWASAYTNKMTSTVVKVSGGGSALGFTALQQQATDLCNASREIRKSQIAAFAKIFGKKPMEFKVCLDGVSVYVNRENPIEELSVQDIEGIFTGRIKNWKTVGGVTAPIVLYSRETNSGTYEFFTEHLFKGKSFSTNVQTKSGTTALLQAVSVDKNGIGYGGVTHGSGVKPVRVKQTAISKAILASEETVVGGTYPLWRYLYVYVNPASYKDDVKLYLNWIRSNEGQKVVREVGFYPLPADLRE